MLSGLPERKWPSCLLMRGKEWEGKDRDDGSSQPQGDRPSSTFNVYCLLYQHSRLWNTCWSICVRVFKEMGIQRGLVTQEVRKT